MTIELHPQPLTPEAFAPFGRVIEADPKTARQINAGTTTRFHALATADPGPDGKVIISFFHGLPRPRPIAMALMERHPLGSQAFVPMQPQPWLVVVAERPEPEALRAFLVRGDQGVQYARGVWHHPLLVLAPAQDFVVVDREGPGVNYEEVLLADNAARLIVPAGI
ncbi:MAG: ureidoglycolate lyase [Geminicoccaceae bacterium]